MARRALSLVGVTTFGVLMTLAIACGSETGGSAPAPTVEKPVPTVASAAPTPVSVPLERGAALYVQKCSTCHGDREGRGGIPDAPAHNDTGHTWHHPDAQLRDWVLNGKIGFSRMPPQKDNVSDEELTLILEYIKTWWTPDQRAFQEDVSKRYQQSLERNK